MKKLKLHIPHILLGILYIVLPTQNANIDSWYYAACVKHHHELINSHHLLYNVWGAIWFEGIKFIHPNIEALEALNLMNALAATSAIICFYYILLKLNQSQTTSILLSVFTGLCFGFVRFATDAETYILPILFSLLSTYFYLKPVKQFNIIISALFSLLAVCTHQIHFWWSLVLFIAILYNHNISLKSKIIYSLILSSGVLVYYLAYLYNGNTYSFKNFILGEYLKGGASIEIGPKSIVLTLINSVRTIFQIHGLIYHFAIKHIIISIIILGIELWLLIDIFKNRKNIFSGSNEHENSKLSLIFAVAFLLQLAFALMSSGNAEFMVMLPFLGIAYASSLYKIQIQKPFLKIILFIGIWNVYFGIIPFNIENISQTNKQINYTETKKEAYFLWSNKPLIENQLNYQNGFLKTYRFITIGDLDSCLTRGLEVYTDLGNVSTQFSRKRIVEELISIPDQDPRQYRTRKVDSFDNLYGENYIYLFDKKNENSIFAP